jgi:hypothetical protein
MGKVDSLLKFSNPVFSLHQSSPLRPLNLTQVIFTNGGEPGEVERREEYERAKNKDTPRRVAIGMGRLSLLQQGTIHTMQGGEEMEADFIRFPEETKSQGK